MTVLRASADLYNKQVSTVCKCGKQVFYSTNITVHLYCYLDGIRSSWLIYNDNEKEKETKKQRYCSIMVLELENIYTEFSPKTYFSPSFP